MMMKAIGNEEEDARLLEAVKESYGSYASRVKERADAGEPGSYDANLVASMSVVEVRRLNGNRVFVAFVCEPSGGHSNVLGAMHGGAVATAVDVATSFAVEGLRTLQGKPPTVTVSVSLGVDFARPAIGRVRFECVAESFGKRLCHTSCRVADEGGRTIATGKHVKAIVGASSL